MKINLLIAFLGLTFSWTVLAQELPPPPAPFQFADGKTFSIPGPNCFATALKLNGYTRSFRGMGDKEFTAYTKLFCRKVDSPQMGDIGVFETKGFGFIHAYAYVSPDLVMQKPGVDYAGPTAVKMYSIESVNFTYLASPECRRYAPDIGLCSNLHYHLRCAPMSMLNDAHAEANDQIVRQIEARMDYLLNTQVFGENEVRIYRDSLALLETAQTSLAANGAAEPRLQDLLEARLISLHEQLKFIKIKLQQ